MKKLLLGATLAGVTATGGTFAADRAQNPYVDEGTHYKLELTSDIPQGERVEVAKDRAEMTVHFWNDEEAIKIIPQIPSTLLGSDRKDFVAEANRPLLSKRMEWKSEDVTAFIEPRSDNEFDIDFTLDSKPDTNVFTYKIEGADNFSFYYQPALTAEEMDQGAERPENVVGSYAVYHKTKANHRIGSVNYATGKAFHIYRPKAIDANGVETWAELSYSDDVLAVTVPQEWLEKAIYPVVVDPTLGVTTFGTSETFAVRTAGAFENSTRSGHTNTPDVSGVTTRMAIGVRGSFGIADSSVDCSVFINSEDTGADSHSEIASASRTDVAFDGTTDSVWQLFDITASLTSSVPYVLNQLCDWSTVTDGADIKLFFDTIAAVNNYTETFSGAGAYATGQEDPWTEDETSSAVRHSIYLIYNTTQAGTYIDTFGGGEHIWKAPTGITSADVACWGGGGGGFDDNTGTNGGAGGGGGAFASSTVSLTPGNTYSVTVATTSPENQPTVGKFSQFVSDDKTVKACGGTGATSATANGVGGTTACSTGDVESAGGVGADAVTTDDTGGGGGGAGGPTGTGGAAANGTSSQGGGGGGAGGGAASGNTGGTSPTGGHGGNGGSGSNGVAGTLHALGGGGGGGGDNGTFGGNGGVPGGGGGGGEGNGGLGAQGQCTITYTVAAAPPAAGPADSGIIFFE